MGLLNKLAASAVEAKNIVKKCANETIEYAETNFANEEWYKKTKEIGNVTKEAACEVSKEGKGLLTELSKSEVGKYVGSGARNLATNVSQLPILTIVTDIIKSKNGIDKLYQLVKDDPHNAEKYIWLAEGMVRVKSDRKIYLGFRSVIHPSSIIFRETLKTATKMGLDDADPVEIRILKNAYYISVYHVKKNPRDSKHLHVLARVYLLMGQIRESIKFSKLAILADPQNKLPYITLSRAYLAKGRYLDSKKAAKIAIANNLKYGYDIIAQLVLLDDQGDFKQKTGLYSSLRDKIGDIDKINYLGCSINEASFIESIGQKQASKFSNVINKSKKYLDKI